VLKKGKTTDNLSNLKHNEKKKFGKNKLRTMQSRKARGLKKNGTPRIEMREWALLAL
jgi:hypothetical protein